MRPLARIRSISAVDLQTIAIPMLNHPKNLSGYLAHRQVAFHRHQAPFLLVVFRYGPGLQVICLQTFPDHFLAIIAADYQLGTVDIANVRDARWLEIDVIDVSVGETSPASSEPLYQLIIVYVDADHNWQALAAVRVVKDLAFKKSIQPARLSGRTRKPVKDETGLAIGVPEPRSHHFANQIVRNQFASSHNRLGLLTQLGAALYVVPQNVSSRYLRNTIVFGNSLGLCAFASTRWPKQHNWPDVLRGLHRTDSTTFPAHRLTRSA